MKRGSISRRPSPTLSANVIALVQWFTRRYPSGADRLAYARRAYRRWQRGRRADDTDST